MSKNNSQPSDSDGYDERRSEEKKETRSWAVRAREGAKIAVLSGEFVDYVENFVRRLMELLPPEWTVVSLADYVRWILKLPL